MVFVYDGSRSLRVECTFGLGGEALASYLVSSWLFFMVMKVGIPILLVRPRYSCLYYLWIKCEVGKVDVVDVVAA